MRTFWATGPEEALRSVEQAGVRSARSDTVRKLARAGYYAKAFVYAVIGTLAVRVAIGTGGKTTDSRGAIATAAQAPFGKILVVALAAGLAGLALWNVVEAVGDPERRRRDGAWALLSRVGQLGAGLAYGSLALAALRMALGDGRGPSGEQSAEAWTARALALPAGRWIVLAGAAVALFVGGRQIWVGVRRKFLEKLDTAAMGARLRRWSERLGAAGFTAQGTVFAVVGVFFAFAAIRRSPGEATGFDGALARIAAQPWGMALLFAVAVGLLAFAAFAVVEGRHRRLGRR